MSDWRVMKSQSTLNHVNKLAFTRQNCAFVRDGCMGNLSDCKSAAATNIMAIA